MSSFDNESGVEKEEGDVNDTDEHSMDNDSYDNEDSVYFDISR